ncbi:hypothetical protein FV113G1_15560 [Fusobacterium varium]|nr:hypothetical protein FV113G1_15560 [Fusobacterium varium]
MKIGKFKIFKIFITALLCIVYYNRYSLYQFLPAQSDENYSIINEVMANNDSQKPYTGRLKTDFGDRIEIYSYKNGLLNGLNVAYQNGKIKEIGHWKNNLQNGVFKLYTDKGILVDDTVFKDGNRNGITKQYYNDTGNLRVEAYYIDGLLDGKIKEYYQNKKLLSEITYSHGKMNGLAKEYYENGQKKVEMYYENNIPKGSYKMYDSAGQIQLEGTFENGKFTPVSETDTDEITLEEVEE